MYIQYESFVQYLQQLSFMLVIDIQKGLGTFTGVAKLPFDATTATFEKKDRVAIPLEENIDYEKEPEGTHFKGKYIAGILEEGKNGNRLVRWFFCPQEVRWLCKNLPFLRSSSFYQVVNAIDEMNRINELTNQKTWKAYELVAHGQRELKMDYRTIMMRHMAPYLIPPTEAIHVAKEYFANPSKFAGISIHTIEHFLIPPHSPSSDRDWKELDARWFKCRCCGATMRMKQIEYQEIYLKGIQRMYKCDGCHVSSFAYKYIPPPKEEVKSEPASQPIRLAGNETFFEGFDESGKGEFVL